MFRVKNLVPEDFDFAVQITDQMKWRLSRADFEFMLELEPEGCFVLLSKSEKVGIATTTSFGKIGWFGNLIVNESIRGKGGGSLLVNHAVRYLKEKGVLTVGLYAYLNRIQFYKRLGFKRNSDFTVVSGIVPSTPAKKGFTKAKKQDLGKITDYDALCFGASRKRLLEPIVSDPDNICYRSIEKEQIVGYAVAKVYNGMAEIGPLVCKHGRDDIAITLLNAILDKLKGFEVTMYSDSEAKSILGFLKTFGIHEDFRVARMFLGPPAVTDCVYAAESLERG